MKRFLSLLTVIAFVGITNVWGDDTPAASFTAASVINGSSTYNSFANTDFYLSRGGGGNNATAGWNKTSQAMQLDSTWGVSGITAGSTYGFYVKCKPGKPLSNINKIVITSQSTTSNGYSSSDKLYLLYSTNNGKSWSQVSLTSGTQGASAGTSALNKTFQFNTISSARYIVLFSGNSTSQKSFRFDKLQIDFYSAYTVSLDANGGSVTPTSVTQNSFGSAVTLPTPTKTGYTCTGWFTSTSGGTKRANAGANYTPTSNETVHAQWTAKTISLILNKNNSDASGSSNGSASVKYDATALESGTVHATRTGYELEGYYAEQACTHKVLTSEGALVSYTGYVVSGKWARATTPTTLYAKWTQTAACTATPSVGVASLNGSFSLTQVGVQCASADPGTNCSLEEWGFVWGESNESGRPNYWDDNVLKNTGSYSANYTNTISSTFSTGTTYYYRGYATNGNEDLEASVGYSSEVKSFTPQDVIFYDNKELDGDEYDYKVVNKGTKVTPKGTPSKTGYTFRSWVNNDDDSDFDCSSTNVDGNLILYADWTVNQHTLTWSTNGDALSGDYTGKSGKVNFGTTIVAPNTPTKTGYTFKAWSPTVAGTMPDNDVTYTATWTANKYDITYKDQGDVAFTGSHADGHPTQHTYGTATTLKGATKTGYTFGGWFANKECTGDAVTSLGATAYTAGMTLYAKWTIKSCTVEFDKQSGEGGTNSETATYGAALPDITAPTRLHYIFQGYYDAATNGTKYYNADGTSAKNWDKDVTTNTTLYAHWTEHTYTNYRTLCCTSWADPEVSYSSSSINVAGTATVTITGTTHGSVSYASSNESVLSVAANGTVTGVGAGTAHVIVSWTEADGYCEKTMNSEDITVQGNVTVVFHANNDTEETMDNQSIPVNEATALSANTFTAPSCKYFYGWATSKALADAGTRAYTDGQSVTITEGLNLYAIWKTYRYAIATPTKVGAATATLDVAEVDCDGEVTVTCTADASHKGDPTIEITPSDAGTVNGNKIENIVNNITAITVTYAAKEVYTVTWKVGGTALTGDALTGVTTSVMEGQGLTNLPEDPEGDALDGADTFMGWSKSELSGLGNGAPSDLFTAAGDEPEINGNVTYHAVFATQTAEEGDSWDLCSAVNDVTAGDYVITWNNEKYLPSETAAESNPAYGTGITINSQDNTKLSNTVTSAMQWSFAGNNTDGWTVSHVKGNTTYYLGSTDKAQGIVVATSNSSYTWKVSVDNTKGMLLHGAGSDRYLAGYTNDWRYYQTSNYSGTLRLYKHNQTEAAYANYITKVVALSSIAVTTGPTKTVYKKGETLDLTNMVVTATYADETSRAVMGYTIDLDGALSTDDTKFVVTYEENGVSKTAEQAIKVYELSGIAITTDPTTTTYKSGATLSTEGMVVTATWGGEALDKIVETVTGYTVDPSTNLATTDTEFEVSYTHENVTKTTTKEIHVYDLSGISITAPAKTSYTAGDVFNPAGMVVTATWGGEALDKIVETVDGYTYSEEPLVNDGDVAANVDVTISYTSNGVTKTATQEVTVAPKAKKIMTWHVANEDPFTTRIYVNAQDKYILALPDDPDPVAAGFTSDYVFKGWTTATSVNKDGTSISYASAGTEMSDDEDFYAVFALASEEESAIFTETFNDCAGTGGNDDKWSGSIASSTVITDNSGWSNISAGGANKCIKLGAGSTQGSAQTPTISMTGSGTLTFRAGAWSGDATTLNLSASGATLGRSSVTLKDADWDEYEIAITNATGSVRITFQGKQASKARFFLDDVEVTAPTTTYSNYRLVPSAVKKPTISLAEGTYYGAQTVTLSQEDSKPIYYTLNGTVPTNESTLYSSAISLNEAGTKTLKAVAWDATVTDYSLVASAEYTIVTEIDAPTMPATQKFFDESMEVEISHALSGEEGFNLQYSYDGETWTDYTSALTITETKTVYAKATIGTLMSEANATYTKGVTVGYTKITTDAEMAIGMKFIIASGNNAAGAITGTNSYMDRVELTNTQNTDATKYITNEAVSVFELGGRSSKYTLTTEGSKLGCGGEKSVNYNGSYIQWTIAFTDGTPAIKSTNSSYSSYELKYNTSSPRFTMYSGQTAVDIFVEPFTAHTLTIKNYDGSDKLTAKVVEGGSFVLTNDDKPSGYPATYKFLDKWTDGTNTYAVGDAVPMGDADMTLQPCWKVTPTDDVIDIDGLPENVTEIVVSDGKDLNVNDDRTINTLTIKSTSGAYEVAGASGQVTGGNTLTVTDNLFLEIKLCDGDMDATASSKWYCIAAPFDVAINGGFYWGDGTPMELNTHFQLFEWDGDRRATGASGWRRTSSDMKAHTAYFIGFDDERIGSGAGMNQNTIKLKAKSNTISNVPTINAPTHSGSGGDDYANWNGLANPNFYHVALSKDVHAFNYNKQTYSTYEAGDYNFVVGTPFFLNETGNITISVADNTKPYRAPKREGENYKFRVRIGKSGAEIADNHVYVRASETASASYEKGHDVITMNGTTATSALIWTENYGGKRLAIEEAPLVNGEASYVLTLSAPANGTYTLSVAEAKDNADLYLTYDGTIIWNLSMGEYEIDLNKGMTNGYGLLLKAKAPGVATGIENGEVLNGANGVQKIIVDDKVFILRGGQMYDVTGKMVK